VIGRHEHRHHRQRTDAARDEDRNAESKAFEASGRDHWISISALATNIGDAESAAGR
jgi:hypothetical protein